MRAATSWLALLIFVFVHGSTMAANPHKLSVRVLNPYASGGETHANWGPPAPHTPWLGDWACDLWKDNFAAGLGNTCGRNVYVKVRSDEVPGGNKAKELRARVLQQGFACRSGVYSQGGYMLLSPRKPIQADRRWASATTTPASAT